MTKNVVYPGTFDPITKGHVDIVHRACSLFDHIIVGVSENSVQNTFFNLDERLCFVKNALHEYNNVEVFPFKGLLIDFASNHNTRIILRGMRAISDFEYEFQLVGMNRAMNKKIESVFLMPSEKYYYISSSLVREIASLGGDVSPFVTPEVEKAMREALAKKRV